MMKKLITKLAKYFGCSYFVYIDDEHMYTITKAYRRIYIDKVGE